MATPKPTPKPGTNVGGRTPKEQMDYERYEKSKKIGQGDDFTNSPVGKFIGGIFKKTPKTTIAPGPSKAKLAAIAKAKAKKKMTMIPKSPTS
jgi:hypothetical protein